MRCTKVFHSIFVNTLIKYIYTLTLHHTHSYTHPYSASYTLLYYLMLYIHPLIHIYIYTLLKVCNHPFLFGEPKDESGQFIGEANPRGRDRRIVSV